MALRFLLCLALFVGMAGCGSATPMPSVDDVARAQTRWPDATLQDLRSGRALYLRKCTECHALSPGDFSPEQWRVCIDEMADRARLVGTQRERILRYLVTVGERPGSL